MRELFAVALSEDGASVVLATSSDGSGGRFRLAMDARLEAAGRGELPRFQEQAPPRESSVTPREIQARLRTGESVEQIASGAGVDAYRVERFAGPVLSERTQMVDSARAATLVRGRRGPSAVPLGVAVDEQLSGLRAETAAWSTVRQETGSWLIEVTYVARGRGKTCRWRYDPYSRVVSAEDPASADLGHLDAVLSRPALNPPSALVVDPGPELFAAGKASGAGPVKAKTGATRSATTAKQPANKPGDDVGSAPDVPGEAPVGADDQVAPPPVGQQLALRVVPGTEDAEQARTIGDAETSGGDDSPAAPAASHRDPASPAPRSRASAATEGSGDLAHEQGAAAPSRTRQPARQVSRPSKTGKRASVPAWADVLLSTSAKGEDGDQDDRADQDPPTVLRDRDGSAG